MTLSNLKLEIKEVVKLTGFVGLVGSMWYDLKTDFAVHEESHKLIEYRLNQLEKVKEIAQYKPKFAILAEKPERKDYE